jgi:hypothetical protein
MKIATASWFAPLPDTHQKVGVSRGQPRGLKAGTYRGYRRLAPGAWFKSVTPDRYLELYNDVLRALDPKEVAADLIELGNGKIPTMLCFESARDIQAGDKWCHRHLAAKWLEDQLGIEIEEVGVPNLDRFALLRKNNIAEPSYKGKQFARPEPAPPAQGSLLFAG